MLSILVEVKKDGAFLKQMLDISAITTLVKWCSDSKKTSIGHFSLCEIEGIILNKFDVFFVIIWGGIIYWLFLKKITT